jgi:probable HAF family extracellular repeat protein
MDGSQHQMLRLARYAFFAILGLPGPYAMSASAQASSSSGTPAFSVAEIPSLGGNPALMLATGINDAGQVTGSSYIAGSAITHAFLYSDGVTQDLGTLGGSESDGSGINNAAEITGLADAANGTINAFLYRDGVMHNLGSVVGIDSVGYAINESGQIIGSSQGGAFLYSRGAAQYLTSSAGTLSPSAINAAGEVLGLVASNGPSQTFLYSGGLVSVLGTLGGNSTHGTALNKSGQVTGYSLNAGGTQLAFLYSNGVMQSLGSLWALGASAGAAINASGQVTGSASVPDGEYSGTHAFLYSNGVMQDLGTLGGSGMYDLSGGQAINASGEVTGASYTASGAQHAFLFTKGTLYDLNSLIAASPLAPYVTLTGTTAITDTGYLLAQGVDTRNGSIWFVLHRQR